MVLAELQSGVVSSCHIQRAVAVLQEGGHSSAPHCSPPCSVLPWQSLQGLRAKGKAPERQQEAAARKRVRSRVSILELHKMIQYNLKISFEPRFRLDF